MSSEDSRESRILSALAARALQRKGEGFPATDEEIEAFKRKVAVPAEAKEEATKLVAQAVDQAVTAAAPALPSPNDQDKPGAPARQPGGAQIKEIGDFELLAKIGQGGMGSVFKARQKSLDRIVALKILPPSIAKDAQFIERFQREARASARFNHPNIVLGIDVGQDAATGLWYFAMEYIDGPTLKQVLAEKKVLPEEQALKIIRDIAAALECVAKNGMVHRDVKPDNILLTSRGEPKLADLGLTRQAKDDGTLTRTGVAIGTPYYMAPEQIRGDLQHLDIRADLYALGATLFHLVTGQPPFDGTTGAAIMARHLTEPPPLARRVNPAVSEATSRMIQRLMQKEPESRFQTPNEVVQHIERILSGSLTAGQRAAATGGSGDVVRSTGPRPHTAPREAPAEGATQERKPLGLYIGIGAGAMVLLALAFVFLFGGREAAKPGRKSAPTTTSTEAVGPSKASETIQGPSGGELRTKLEALLKAAQDSEKDRPDDYRGAKRKYEELASRARGTPLEREFVARAQEALPRIQERWQGAAEAAWGELEQKAAPLIAGNDYDGALKVYAELPASFADLLGRKSTEKSAALRQEGEGKIKPALEAAEEASKNAEPQKGLDALAKVEAVKLAPLSEQVAALKKRLQDEVANAAELEKKRAQQALEKKLNEHLGRFDTALFEKGDLAAAREAATAAQNDAALKPQHDQQTAALSELIKAVEEVQKQEAAALKAMEGKELTVGKDTGVVKKIEDGVITLAMMLEGPGGAKASAQKTVKLADLTAEQRAAIFTSVKPADTPAGKIVAALGKALSGGDLVKVEESLKTVPDSPLKEHYVELVRLKRLGAAEVAAEKAWPELEQAAGAPCTTPEQGKRLQTRLDEWRAAHGKTKFAETKNTQLQEWRTKADRAVSLNLLALVNLTKHAVAGTWKADGQALVSDAGPCSRIMLPYEVPAEYDYRVDFTRNSGSAVCLILSKDGRDFVVETGWPGGVTGFAYVNGAHINTNPTKGNSPVTNGHRYSYVVQVRNTGLKLLVDGKLISAYQTDYKNVTPHGAWALPNTRCLGFGSYASPTTFHVAELIPAGSSTGAAEVAADKASGEHSKKDEGKLTPGTAAGSAPVPPEAEIAAQQQAVRNLYKAEYAARDQTRQLELAGRLLDRSASGSDTERIALLREAVQVAAKAGDLDTARGACNTLVSGWKVDAGAERLALYQAAAFTSNKQAIAAAGDLVAAADTAIDADNFAIAKKMAEFAANLAQRCGDESLANQAMASANRARDLGAEFAKAGGADLLGDRPRAQRATLGRFYALSKGDWDRALPLLAEDDDATLKAAAAADLAAKTADEREQVGEQWAELARKAPAKSRPQFFRRALDNLIQAADGAAGLAKARLDKRVAELEQLAGRPRGSVAAAPPGVLFWLDGEPGPDGKGIVDAGPSRLKLQVAGKVQLLREGHGGYMRFDASGGITVPFKPPVPATSSISVAFWVRNTDKQPRSGVIGIGQSGNILVHPNGGTMVFLEFTSKCGLPQAGLGKPGNGVWRHLAFVMDALKKESFLYIDGTQAERTPGPTSPLTAAIDAVQVGTSRWGPIIGDLDSVGFWSRALNPGEVKALYTAGKTGRGR